jgi:hypothetical protein
MRGAAMALLVLLGTGLQSLAAGPSGDAVDLVTLGPDTNLRLLAQRYLRDPDAWPEILRASHLEFGAPLQPGMELRVPTGAMERLEQVLRELHQTIYQATSAGAQVLASESLEEALLRQAEASRARRERGLAAAAAIAEQGLAAARAALASSRAQRDHPAEARLDEAGGRVERRREKALDWSPAKVEDLLAERERLRTLSRSFALVRFRDASRVRLDEHADLMIRRIRRDDLTRRETLDLVLYGGAARAVLGEEASRQKLSLHPEGVETQGQSRHYWVEKSPQKVLVANYEGALEISAGGGRVVLKESQGTQIARSGRPDEARELLAAPEPREPADGQPLYGRQVALRWSAVAGAASYWLEVARDPDLTRLVLSDTAVAETGYALGLSEEGVYFWRVSSVDASGLPGPPGSVSHFQLARDETAPYLRVEHPVQGQRAQEPRVLVEGQTEPDARLRINGAKVEVMADGRYRHPVELRPGANRLALAAQDSAGNTRELESLVYLAARAEASLELAAGVPRDAAGRLLARRHWTSLEGKSLADATVEVASRAGDFLARTTADAAGHFALSVPAAERPAVFDIRVQGPLGQSREDSFETVLDAHPPVIRLDTSPSLRSAEPTIRLHGRVEDGAHLRLGERPVALDAQGRFSVEAELDPGLNALTLTAADLAGNLGHWRGLVLLDREPPALAAFTLAEDPRGDRQSLLVEFQAEDASGLVATAPYRVKVGAQVLDGVARRGEDPKRFWDRLRLPAERRGRPRLSTVTLEDDLGNRREIRLD